MYVLVKQWLGRGPLRINNVPRFPHEPLHHFDSFFPAVLAATGNATCTGVQARQHYSVVPIEYTAKGMIDAPMMPAR
jgi:hypothetical protein